MANTWFISDTHFGHENALKFLRRDGTPLRDFPSVEAMDQFMVDQWNSVVRDRDLVYHLGDVSMRVQHIKTLEKLKGRKRLVRGNHDIFPDKVYRKYFDKLYGVRVLRGAVCSHVPLHPGSVERWGFNIHGHLHADRVMAPTPIGGNGDHGPEEDIRYINVSVEQINYKPISLDEIRAIAEKRGMPLKGDLSFA